MDVYNDMGEDRVDAHSLFPRVRDQDPGDIGLGERGKM